MFWRNISTLTWIYFGWWGNTTFDHNHQVTQDVAISPAHATKQRRYYLLKGGFNKTPWGKQSTFSTSYGRWMVTHCKNIQTCQSCVVSLILGEVHELGHEQGASLLYAVPSTSSGSPWRVTLDPRNADAKFADMYSVPSGKASLDNACPKGKT